MTVMPKMLPVAAIRNGTVIDHIPAYLALKIILLLKLDKHDKMITIGLNLPSSSYGLKDIIKVEKELTLEEANQVAIFAPKATINIIQDYEVAKKFKVQIPSFIEGIFSCANPRCVSNHEKIKSYFHIIQRPHQVFLQCRYCKKSTPQDEIIKLHLMQMEG
jgi:aspartate carbamoyltransferase regulatory subunit